MSLHSSLGRTFSTGTPERAQSAGFRAATAPARHHSFILGRSDARLRSLLNQEERDRLHCLSLLVAGIASAAGLMLLLTAAFP